MKNILKQKAFPELRGAEKELRKIAPTIRGTRPIIKTGNEAEEAFGKEKMKNPQFNKELRRLQEKYRITGYV